MDELSPPLPQAADARSAPADVGDPAARADPWRMLNRLTPARIGLGRSGISQPTAVQLDFQLAHAQARDAVHLALDVDGLCNGIEALGLRTIALHSAAESRAVYLQRPDLGRRLDARSRERLLGALADDRAADPAADKAVDSDLSLVVADGLSALAVQRHAAALIEELIAGLPSVDDGNAVAGDGWRLAPVTVVQQGRVAIGDEIGGLLRSRLVVVLIGERPGLSSPDSLGLYLTWDPHPGRNDAQRNCISNVRPEGLGYREAAARLIHLLQQSRQRQLSGVELKDDSQPPGEAREALASLPPFLLGDHGSSR